MWPPYGLSEHSSAQISAVDTLVGLSVWLAGSGKRLLWTKELKPGVTVGVGARNPSPNPNPDPDALRLPTTTLCSGMARVAQNMLGLDRRSFISLGLNHW